jgi:hypothetical protein
MINVWEQKKSRESDRIYYKNILTNKSEWNLPTNKNGVWKKVKDELNNTLIIFIPTKNQSYTRSYSGLLKGGADLTLEMYNELNPDYPMSELPIYGSPHYYDWMTDPFRTSEQLRAFWVYKGYNRYVVNDDEYWDKIMEHMQARIVLSYNDLNNFYKETRILHKNKSKQFLLDPVHPFEPQYAENIEPWMTGPFRNSEELLAYWIYKGYNQMLIDIWREFMEYLDEHSIDSYEKLENLYERTPELHSLDLDTVLDFLEGVSPIDIHNYIAED